MNSVRECPVCGDPIDPSKRSDTITCSDVCRLRRHRYKNHIQRQTDRALEGLRQVALSAHGSMFAKLALAELEYILDYAKAVHTDVYMSQTQSDWYTDTSNQAEAQAD